MNTKHEKFRNKNHTHIRCWKSLPLSPCPTLMPPSAHLPFFLLLTLPFLWHGAFHVANGNRPLENEIRFAFCTHAYTHTHTHTRNTHQPPTRCDTDDFGSLSLCQPVKEFKLRVLFTIETPTPTPRPGLNAMPASSLFAHELLNCAHLPRKPRPLPRLAPASLFHSALVTVKFLLAMRDAKRQRFVSTDGQFSIFLAQLELNMAERKLS